MPVRLVWRTDVHLSDQTPRSRLDNWADTVLGKLAQVGEVARRVEASAVIDGGDFFHVKSPFKNSHGVLRRVVEVHQKYPCPVYANVGNHDCKFGEISYLHQQPLGVLFEAGVFKRLYDKHEAFFEKDGVSVRVVGVPYHGSEYDIERLRVKKGKEDYLIVVAHVYASEQGGSMYGNEEVLSYNDLLGFDADVFMFGHWHKDQGIMEKGGKTFVNIGSLTRGSLSDEEVDRIPSCAVMSFTKSQFKIKQFPLTVSPANEIFDLVGKVKIEKRAAKMEEYVANLQEELSAQVSINVEERVGKLENLPIQVKEKALYYLEQAKSDG